MPMRKRLWLRSQQHSGGWGRLKVQQARRCADRIVPRCRILSAERREYGYKWLQNWMPLIPSASITRITKMALRSICPGREVLGLTNSHAAIGRLISQAGEWQQRSRNSAKRTASNAGFGTAFRSAIERSQDTSFLAVRMAMRTSQAIIWASAGTI